MWELKFYDFSNNIIRNLFELFFCQKDHFYGHRTQVRNGYKKASKLYRTINHKKKKKILSNYKNILKTLKKEIQNVHRIRYTLHPGHAGCRANFELPHFLSNQCNFWYIAFFYIFIIYILVSSNMQKYIRYLPDIRNNKKGNFMLLA